MDASAEEYVDGPCGGAAFGKICLQGGISNGSSGVVRHLLVPPVEEFLNVCRSTIEVVNNKPVKGLVVKSIVDLAPLGSGLKCKVKLCGNIKINSI